MENLPEKCHPAGNPVGRFGSKLRHVSIKAIEVLLFPSLFDDPAGNSNYPAGRFSSRVIVVLQMLRLGCDGHNYRRALSST